MDLQQIDENHAFFKIGDVRSIDYISVFFLGATFYPLKSYS